MMRRCIQLGTRANCVARVSVLAPALTNAPPPIGQYGTQPENPAAPLKVAAPTDTRPAAPQPEPTQLPAGFATAQPRAAHALASMAVQELPGAAGGVGGRVCGSVSVGAVRACG